MIPFLFTDLELSFCQNLLDNVRDGGGVEGFLELRGWRESTFGNVGEDVGDLEDLVNVFLAGISASKGISKNTSRDGLTVGGDVKTHIPDLNSPTLFL
jgi:hypothetical protein